MAEQPAAEQQPGDPRPRPTVALAIGDDNWLGWTYADIVATIDGCTGSFSIGVTERFEGVNSSRPNCPGESCKLTVDGEPVISGYIDLVQPFYDAEQHGVNVSGRDRTADLVDCSAAVLAWQNVSFVALLNTIASPLGIRVYLDPGLSVAGFARFAINPGESAWTAIDRACRARKVLAVARPDGDLQITRAATAEAPTSPVAVILGGAKGTAVRASGTFDWRDRYSEYRVLAQNNGAGAAKDRDTDKKELLPLDWNKDDEQTAAPEARAHIDATATDPGVTRYRPLIMTADDRLGQVGAAEQAQWVANIRRGRSLRASYTVAGWRDDLGRLWRPNTRVRIEDEWLAINRELLVVSVRLSIHDDAYETDLELAEPLAYSPAPEQPDALLDEVTGKKVKKTKGRKCSAEDAELRQMGWGKD